MPVSIHRKFEFDSAHRVWGHESKCKHLHGHRYVAEVHVTAPILDSLGRIIDFGVLKERIGKWIDDNLDHNTILNSADPLLEVVSHNKAYNPFTHKMPFVISGRNPTAEVIAEVIYNVSVRLLQGTGIETTKVVVFETPNCSATFVPEYQSV